MRCDVCIYAGKTQFEADQISRLLDIKVPPLVKSRKTTRPRAGPLVEFDEDVVPLGLRIIGTHLFAWNIEGTILRDVAPMDLWVPYDFNLIMRRGHEVNTSIPEDSAEAEFPDFPWGDQVTIRIKSHGSPSVAPVPTPAKDSPRPFIPPGSWQGPALGQAPSISPDAAALVSYTSPNTGQDGTTLGDLPPDLDLLRVRGELDKDEEIHRMIEWTTRKDYPLMVGLSLPIADHSFDGAHEAQLWEETNENWILDADHAAKAYQWLIERFLSRSMHQLPPAGMPESVSDLSITTWKDGKAGYILFTPTDMIATKMADSETKALI
jgi:hypothetical protein